VQIETDATEDAPARTARARTAVYTSTDGGVIVLRGEPPPTVETGGVLFTAPTIRMHVADKRLVSPDGPMKAVISRKKAEP
jgi:hypothetical protein